MMTEGGPEPFHSWDPNNVYSLPKCLLCEQNPKTPVVRPLSDPGFVAGSRLLIDGSVDRFSAGFTVDFVSGSGVPHSSVASGIPLRFQVSMTQSETYLSAKRGGHWEVKDLTNPNSFFPFMAEELFTLQFVHKNRYIEVLVNNQFHTALKVPANEKLTMVEISGKVKISQLRIDNPLIAIVRETQLPIIRSGPDTAICRYVNRSGNRALLWPGSKIIVNGTLALGDAKRFHITIQQGSVEQKSESTALQITFNLLAMVARFRSKSSQSDWLGNQQVNLANHRAALNNDTRSIEVIVDCQLEFLRVALNGGHLTNYPHAIDFTQADYVIISGDIKTNAVRVA